MFFYKKAQPHRKHLVFYAALLYNKEVFPFTNAQNIQKTPRKAAAKHTGAAFRRGAL